VVGKVAYAAVCDVCWGGFNNGFIGGSLGKSILKALDPFQAQSQNGHLAGEKVQNLPTYRPEVDGAESL